jgi:uncharacterized OsmC-like protein
LKIPVEGLEVAIDGKMAVAAQESMLSWERRLRIARMTREVRVRGPITEEQRVLLMRGADYCPVDNTLTQSVEIKTTVVVVHG